MVELFNRLKATPWIAAQLLLASLFANVLALASSLFVIQVLNRYVSYGVDATLVTLVTGVLLAIALEACFRQARSILAQNALGDEDKARAEGVFGLLIAARASAYDKVPSNFRRETTRGLEAVEQAYNGPNVAAVLDVPFALMFVLALALLHPVLGLVTAVFVGGVFAFSLMSARQLKGPTAQLAEAGAESQALVATADRAADTVRAFNGQDHMMERWLKAADKRRGLRLLVSDRQGVSQQVTQSAQAIMGVAVITAGALLVVAGQLDVGVMVGANILAGRALGPIIKFAQLQETFAKAREALARARQLAQIPVEADSGATLKAYKGTLEFRDIAFGFDGGAAPLYESLTLKLEPGSVLVVTGRNGSGKTTLARLIMGLIEPTRGQILVDGVDLRQVLPGWWRRQVTYLPQEPLFLNGTIRDNLMAANPDTDEDKLDAALDAAALGEFIDESPEGLDQPLENNGLNLALGIRRRLAIARALVTDGRLVVFDEPTEGLDDIARKAVYAVLKRLAEDGRTIIALSTDPHLLRAAGTILDLNTKPVPTVVSQTVLDELKRRAEANG
ncbi:MAG: peptidase domain-containing ABC transporter [Rhodospirillales bacterium]